MHPLHPLTIQHGFDNGPGVKWCVEHGFDLLWSMPWISTGGAGKSPERSVEARRSRRRNMRGLAVRGKSNSRLQARAIAALSIIKTSGPGLSRIPRPGPRAEILL